MIEDGRIAGVNAGGIEWIAAGGGHEMEITVVRIAEEGISADVAFARPESVSNVAISDVRRSINLIPFICAIGPKNVVDKNSGGATL